MNVSVAKLLEDALVEVGAGPSPGDDLDTDDAARALRYLIRMVDVFQADRLLLEYAQRTPFVLVAGQQVYTIGAAGSGANIIASRPEWISDIRVIPVADTLEIEVVPYDSVQEWYDEPLKAQDDAFPRRYLYERLSDVLGQITFWPKPNAAPTVQIAIPAPLTTPVDLNTVIAFRPGGYYEAWMLNLAKRLVRAFERATEPANLREDAQNALAVIHELNLQGPPAMRMDRALTGSGGFDIRSNRSRV